MRQHLQSVLSRVQAHGILEGRRHLRRHRLCRRAAGRAARELVLAGHRRLAVLQRERSLPASGQKRQKLQLNERTRNDSSNTTSLYTPVQISRGWRTLLPARASVADASGIFCTPGNARRSTAARSTRPELFACPGDSRAHSIRRYAPHLGHDHHLQRRAPD